jgi:hypothetical protein
MQIDVECGDSAVPLRGMVIFKRMVILLKILNFDHDY